MMTEDRIAELRAKVRSYGRYSSYWVGISEMLDEIERLKAALRRIADSPTIGDGNDASTLREWAADAMGWINRREDDE